MLSVDEIKTNFGKHLRKLRESKGWTQEELAEKAHLHWTYVGQIERGVRNPSLINLYRLTEALKIDKGELLKF